MRSLTDNTKHHFHDSKSLRRNKLVTFDTVEQGIARYSGRSIRLLAPSLDKTACTSHSHRSGRQDNSELFHLLMLRLALPRTAVQSRRLAFSWHRSLAIEAEIGVSPSTVPETSVKSNNQVKPEPNSNAQKHNQQKKQSNPKHNNHNNKQQLQPAVEQTTPSAPASSNGGTPVKPTQANLASTSDTKQPATDNPVNTKQKMNASKFSSYMAAFSDPASSNGGTPVKPTQANPASTSDTKQPPTDNSSNSKQKMNSSKFSSYMAAFSDPASSATAAPRLISTAFTDALRELENKKKKEAKPINKLSQAVQPHQASNPGNSNKRDGGNRNEFQRNDYRHHQNYSRPNQNGSQNSPQNYQNQNRNQNYSQNNNNNNRSNFNNKPNQNNQPQQQQRPHQNQNNFDNNDRHGQNQSHHERFPDQRHRGHNQSGHNQAQSNAENGNRQRYQPRGGDGNYARHQPRSPPTPVQPQERKESEEEADELIVVKLPMMGGISIHEFSAQTKIRMEDIRERLMALGEQSLARAVGKNPETMIDVDVAELLALEMGMEIERVAEKGAISSIDQEVMRESLKTKIDQEHLLKRAPVVSVMGHVDHGKTTLLDALRSKTSARAVAGTEAGGITQKLSAFTVVPDGREEEIVFLDTPGHSAFSVMRGQGALATDIVVLVVALDDGVQPQTLEALRCAKSAKCSIVLALNKVDKFHSESEKTKQRRKILLELSNHDLLTEDYGGDVQVVEVSGKSGAGLEQLVESICLQAEVLELKANHSGLAEAVVLESKFEKGRGIIAEVLVRWGALKVGDPIVVGTVMAKIRGLIDENGKQQKVAHPSKLVRVLGFKEIPDSGVELLSVESETQAKSIIDRRRKLLERKAALLEKKAEKKAAKIDRIRGRLGRKRKIIEQRAEEARVAALSPEEAAAEAALDEEEELPMVGVMLRADGSGSLEALRQIVETIADKVAEFVDLRVAEAQIGEIRASDLEKCLGIGETVILAFNVSMSDLSLRSKFKQADIPIFQDDVIYGLEDSLVDKLEEILPKIRTVTKEGSAKVLKTFHVQGKDIIGVAVTEGYMRVEDDQPERFLYRVLRGEEVIFDGLKNNEDGLPAKEVQLKRFKETVPEVAAHNECGLFIEDLPRLEPGDLVECYRLDVETRKIPRSQRPTMPVAAQSTGTEDEEFELDDDDEEEEEEEEE